MAGDNETEWNTGDVAETEVTDGIYTVERVLSEKWAEEGEDHHPPGMRWLVKWDGYGIKDCTWEPKNNFQAEDGSHPSLDAWEDLKETMDEDDFRKLVRKNRARFEWAEKNPEAADKEERAKKLQALVAERKRTRTNISDDEEEAAPICPQKRNSPQQMVPPEVTLADREAIDASQLNNLFLDSQDIPSPGAAPDGDLFVRQPLKERRPPLAQSESSVSDGEETDDSLMAELGEESHHEERKSTGSRGATGERRSTRKSAQSPKSASKRATTASTPKSTKKLNQLNTARNNESRRPLQPQAGTTPRNQEEQSLAQKSATSKPPVRTTSAAQRKASTSAEDTNSAAAVPAGASANTVKSSSGPVGQFTARRTAPGSGASGGIKFVNQPKTQQRGAWQNGDNHYKTLHFRAVADKRSRTEGAPDVSALQIVNDPSVPVQSRSQAPHDDPYARREMGNRRVREEQDTDRLPRRGSDDLYCRREMGNRRYQEQDVDNTPRRGSADEIVPLQPWETDKVPLVCSAWRLSSNCPKTAQQCRFMHRNKDPNGKDYALGDLNGLVPPKHGKPPLTCRYWLLEARGCKNSAEKCLYAHRNTGWLPHEDPAVKEPVQIDPTVLPGYVASRDKRAMRPSELTCWYWTMGQCRNSPEACAFQHYNTGIVADPPPGARLCHDWVRNRHTRCTKGIACKFLHPPASDVSGGDGHVAQRTFLPTSVGTTNADESEEAQPQFADGLLEQPPPQPPLSSFRPPPPPPIEFPPAKAECAQLQAKIEKAYSLDYDKLFARHAGHVDRKALLIYDSEQHAEELEVVTRWLLMHHIEVFSVRSEGAWDRFRQEIMAGGSGVIIAHPDFEGFLLMPGFGQVLRKNVNCWSLGYQVAKECDETRSRGPHVMRDDCLEIFPGGGFIFITDEVFEQKPQLALKIIQLFCEKVEGVKGLDGPLNRHHIVTAPVFWRLHVRPELMEFLFNECVARERALGEGHPEVLALHDTYKLLHENKYIEQDLTKEEPSWVEDKWPIISHQRQSIEKSFAGDDHYFILKERGDNSTANFDNISLAAELVVLMRRDYRDLFVVHTEPDAPYVQKWKSRIQSIAEIITPERAIEEFEKSGRASLFDFYEHLMPSEPGYGFDKYPG